MLKIILPHHKTHVKWIVNHASRVHLKAKSNTPKQASQGVYLNKQQQTGTLELMTAERYSSRSRVS